MKLKCIFFYFTISFVLLKAQSNYNETKIRENLRYIENSYITRLNFEERRRAIEKIDEILDIISRQNNFVQDYRERGKDILIPQARYADLISKLNSFGSDKYTVISHYATRYLFTVDNAQNLMRYFTFDDDKQKFIYLIYPRLVDKENLPRLLNEITFESERKSLTDRLLSE